MKQFKIIVKGKLEEGFFKEFVKNEAKKLNITGYARTQKDGDLRVIAQGEQKDLVELIDRCKSGPGQINDITEKEEPIKEKFASFVLKSYAVKRIQ